MKYLKILILFVGLCLFSSLCVPESRGQCAGFIQDMAASDGTYNGWRYFVCNNVNEYYDGMSVKYNSNPDANFSTPNWSTFPYTQGVGYLTPIWRGAFFVTVYTYDVHLDYYCSFVTIFRYY